MCDFGLFIDEVDRFAGIGGEVVELSRGLGSRIREGIFLEPPTIAVTAGALVVEVFPVAAPDGEGEADGLVEGIFPDGFVRLSEENRQHVEAILCGIDRKLGSGEGRAGGHEISQADSLGGFGPCFDSPGPTRDHGNAVTSFPVVPLDPPPWAGSVVLIFVAHIDDGADLGTVVAGDDHKSLLGEIEVLELLEEFPDDVIELEDEVAMRTCFGFALEVPAGKGGEVNRLQGVKEEEGFFRALFHVGIEELEAFLKEYHVDFLEVEIRGHQARSAVKGPRVLGKLALVDQLGGWNRDPVILHVGVEPIRGGTGDRSKEVIEAAVDRAVGNWPAVVDPAHGLETVLVNGCALLVEEGHPDMPFAEESGGVALLLQHGREGETFLLDQAGPPNASEDATVIQTKGHAPGHDAVAGRRADRGGAVCVGEEHALFGKAVQMRGGDLALRVVAADVSIPKIVGKDEEDVGLVPGRDPRRKTEEKKEKQDSHEGLVWNGKEGGQVAFLRFFRSGGREDPPRLWQGGLDRVGEICQTKGDE